MVEDATARAAAQLREAQLRVTGPRVAVLATLARLDGHVDAETVRQEVEQRLGSVSTQTVYDALRTLTTAGILRCTETPGHPARYEMRVGDNHHHAVCRRCGFTSDVDCVIGAAPCLTAELPQGFVVDEAAVTFRGLCRDCAAADA